MKDISTIIITKNEELNIASCIESVMWSDEVIVVDCGSFDKTQEICKRYATKVKLYINSDWRGFGAQKNYALGFTTSKWVLSVDADEIVTNELMHEILSIPEDTKCAAYKIPRITYFLGKQMKFGFSKISDTPIRLAQKKLCKFSDDVIHEKLIISGKIGSLCCHLDHFSFRTVESIISKISTYSTVGAVKLEKSRLKPSFASAFFHALWVFIKIYFLKLGFLNGWRGFMFAFSNFEGTLYRYLKFIENQRRLYHGPGSSRL